MRNSFTIAAALLVAATAIGAARAEEPSVGQRLIAQEQAKGLHVPAVAEDLDRYQPQEVTAGGWTGLADPTSGVPVSAGLTPSASSPRTSVSGIVAQERGRQLDARLLGPSAPATVQVVGPGDGFDFLDAGIGGAVGLAIALAAAVALQGGRRRRALGAAPARS